MNECDISGITDAFSWAILLWIAIMPFCELYLENFQLPSTALKVSFNDINR